MDFLLSLEDTEWISTQYPGLKIDTQNKAIVGDIYLNRLYNDCVITDIFSIRISLEVLSNSILPKVFETSGKLHDIAKKLCINNLEDIHINSDDSLCLAIRDREKECFSNGFTISEFLENCLEPYLFWVSYYGKFGKAPWGEYAHGHLGILELYFEDRLSMNDLKRRIGMEQISKYLYHYDYIQDKCLCGKNKTMKKCHPIIHNALSKFKVNWKTNK